MAIVMLRFRYAKKNGSRKFKFLWFFTFSESHCTVCAPSRSSIFSGVMPHDGGIVRNGSIAEPGYERLFLRKVLKNAGYECIYGGNWSIFYGVVF